MIKLTNINISYHKTLFNEASISIPQGRITAIVGRSGLGKTTLLNQLAFLDKDWRKHVQYEINDEIMNNKSDKEIARFYRNQYFYLFQRSNFIQDMTCLENIQFLASMRDITVTEKEILDLFEKLEIDIDLNQYPNMISGGQRQKLEIATLELLKPKIILCDEITSSLDEDTAITLFDMFVGIVHDLGCTCVVITHDPKIMAMCDVIYEVEDEKLVLKEGEVEEGPVLLDESHSIELSTYINYIKLKFLNQQFLKSSAAICVMLCILVSVFNLMYRYQQENLSSMVDTLEKTVDHQFIFDYSDDIDLDAVPYSMVDSTVYCDDLVLSEATIHIGDSYEEIENHLLLDMRVTKGAYINLQLADALGIEDVSDRTVIEFDYSDHVEQVVVAGIVDNEYFPGDDGYHVYFLEGQTMIEQEESPDYMMYYESDINQLKDVQQTILDEGLTIYSSLSDLDEVLDQNESINTFMNLLLLILVALLAIFTILYSLMQYKNKQNEIHLLYRRGLRFGSISCFNLCENAPIFLVTFVGSMVISYVASKALEAGGVFEAGNISTIGTYLLISLIISLIILGISQFITTYFYISASRNEEN